MGQFDEKLRPKSATVNLCYHCPICSSHIYLTLTEAKAYDKAVCNYCRKTFGIIVPKLVLSKKITVVQPVLQKPVSQKSTIDESKYVNMLISLGYKSKDAKIKVRQILQLGLSEDKIIKELLK
jgi:transcription elongation factor Elf1